MTNLSNSDPWVRVAEAEPRRSSIQLFLWIGVGLAAVAIGMLNLSLDGNFAATLGFVFLVVFVAVSFFRPSFSLYVLVFLALAVEQIPKPYSWTLRIPYHLNFNNIFPSLSGLAINPLEIHLLCFVAGLILRFIITRERLVRVIAWEQMLVYLAAIVFFIVYGIVRGGEFLPALWETRGIVYLVLLMTIVPQIIRTKDQVRHMIWAIIAGLGSRAIEVTIHYVGANFTLDGSYNGWGNHEDSGMLATLVVFALTMILYKSDRKQRIILLMLVPLMIISIIASDRRTAYPVMGGGLLLFLVIQSPEIQKKILKLAWKVGIVFGLYLAIFWETSSTNIFLTPARLIREGVAGDDKAEASESYTSNLYRKVENYDLQKMITERPLLGAGYGSKIEYFLPIPVQWDLGFYMTHNQILCVIAKTGVIGFTIFAFFYLSVVAEIGNGFRLAVHDKYLQAVLVLVAAAIVNHLVFSFFDIVLTYYRNNVYLGALFGLASTILALNAKHAEDTAATISGQTKETPHWLLLQPPEKVVVG